MSQKALKLTIPVKTTRKVKRHQLFKELLWWLLGGHTHRLIW